MLSHFFFSELDHVKSQFVSSFICHGHHHFSELNPPFVTENLHINSQASQPFEALALLRNLIDQGEDGPVALVDLPRSTEVFRMDMNG